jgi:hypothetical protein
VVPAQIPAEALAARPGLTDIHVGPPPGVSDEECGAVDALVERAGDGGPWEYFTHVPMRLEPGELKRLAAGEPVWLTICGVGLPPFRLAVGQTV